MNELPRGDRDEPTTHKPAEAPPGGSWVPILIDYGPNSHVHGAIWWLWNQPWRTDYLPKGVKLLDANTARRGCGLCERWIALHGWPKDVPKPKNERLDTPQGLFDPIEEDQIRMEEAEPAREGSPQPPEAGSSTKIGEKPDKTESYSDF